MDYIKRLFGEIEDFKLPYDESTKEWLWWDDKKVWTFDQMLAELRYRCLKYEKVLNNQYDHFNPELEIEKIDFGMEDTVTGDIIDAYQEGIAYIGDLRKALDKILNNEIFLVTPKETADIKDFELAFNGKNGTWEIVDKKLDDLHDEIDTIHSLALDYISDLEEQISRLEKRRDKLEREGYEEEDDYDDSYPEEHSSNFYAWDEELTKLDGEIDALGELKNYFNSVAEMFEKDFI